MGKLLLGGFAIVLSTTGCIGGGAPDDVDVTVANEWGSDASFSWQSPGLIGTSLFPATGTEPILACDTYRRGFGVGHHEVVIKAGGQSLDMAFDAIQDANGINVKRYVIIDPSGAIAEATAEDLPIAGCGAPNY